MSELQNAIPFSEYPDPQIANDIEAQWALDQIRQGEETKAFWKAYYDQQYKNVCETCDMNIESMKRGLEAYFDTVPHKTAKTQESYPLPGGKLVRKQQQPEYERDEERVLKWLKKNNKTQFIKTKESLDWQRLKDTLTFCGETASDEEGKTIDGIKVIERPDIFTVQLEKKKEE